MDGFEVGQRYDTMGLRGNDLRQLYFNGRPRAGGERARRARRGLPHRDARSSTTAGCRSAPARSAAPSGCSTASIEHVQERRQFGTPLADFELVQDKIGWMVSYLFGLESMAYLTTGLVDMGVPDYSLESAICKVSGTEFLWYAANRALQLKGGAGYMRDEPYEKMLRDIRIFPIFEGANDVMRAFIALSGIKPLGEELKELGDLVAERPDRLDRRARGLRARARRARGAARSGSRTRTTTSCPRWPTPVTDQVQAPARGQRGRCCASTARSIMERQFAAEAPGRRGVRHLRARSPCSRA